MLKNVSVFNQTVGHKIIIQSNEIISIEFPFDYLKFYSPQPFLFKTSFDRM